MKASYKKRCVGFQTGKGGVEVNIEPGQFVFGRRSAAKELRMDPNTIWKRMHKLKNLQNLTLDSNQQYTIVSIINWNTYQEEISESNLNGIQQVTTKYPASNTNNKDKKEKNNTYSDEFLSFYKEYPRRVDKSGAWKAWEKCNGNRPGIDSLLEILSRHKKTDQWNRDGGKFIPHPATWINKRRWEDEVEVEPAGPFG